MKRMMNAAARLLFGPEGWQWSPGVKPGAIKALIVIATILWAAAIVKLAQLGRMVLG